VQEGKLRWDGSDPRVRHIWLRSAMGKTKSSRPGHRRRTRTDESHVSDKLASKGFMSSSSRRTGLGALRAVLRKFQRNGEQLS
jgi:hypothetical protein